MSQTHSGAPVMSLIVIDGFIDPLRSDQSDRYIVM